MLLDPAKVNLNSGTLFPTPKPILRATDEYRRMMATNPSDFVWRQLPHLIQSARSRFAAYLNCSQLDLLLLPSVTFAINIITASLKLPPGSEILTTDHEYGAMLHAWNRLAARDGLKVRTIELPYRSEGPAEIVKAFEAGMTGQTRVLFFSHVMTSTGLTVPAAEICQIARQREILTVIDGAHAAGLVPLDIQRIGADFYAANCHKWLMAAPAAGFMHVAPHRKSIIESLITSWGFEYDRAKCDEESGNGGSCWQWDFEFHGSADRCPQMALPATLDFRESLGGDAAILQRCRELSQYLREKIDLDCVTPRHQQLSCGALTAFDFPCTDPIQMRDRFWHEHHIECPVTKAAGRTFLRVSTAWFNTTDEIDRLAAAIRKIN